MGNKKYKLVEVSYEEHVALHDAGVWTMWDHDKGHDEWAPEQNILSLGSHKCSRNYQHWLDYEYKFFTRIELE